MEMFHPDFHEKVKERINELNSLKKEVPTIEEVYLKLDATPIDVEVTAVPVEYEGTNGAIVFARDISERKKIEKLRTEMEAHLRQQQKLEAIGTLAGGVAHEINNPLNGIMNYSELVLDEIPALPEAQKYVTEIIHETKRISLIVKNLLQFSRQDKQSHSYADIHDIIEQTVSLINTIIKKDQIELSINFSDDLPPIKCRSQQIQQVIMNLLTNSRDALNEKYPYYHENKKMFLTCTRFDENERKWIRIVVEDNGSGISKDIMDKVFLPFFSTKPKDIGTGLGLSISFGIIKDHHGRIMAESKEGEGTRFTLELPADNGWDLKKE
jgi:signal transduction histidine kinase